MTKRDALERVIKNIQNVGGKMTGIVINRMPITGKKYEQQYYYYGERKTISKGRKTTKKAKVNSVRKFEKNKIEEDIKTLGKQNKLNDVKINKQIVQKNNNLKNNNETESNQTSFLEKTNEILKQINDYIDNEKKNLQ